MMNKLIDKLLKLRLEDIYIGDRPATAKRK